MSTKVRFVRCPKCAKILPEPTGVPLYTCGGCDTVLQAKYYRREDDRTRLSSNEAVPGHRPSSDGQDSLIKAGDQNTVESCNREQPDFVASVSKTSSSNHSLPVKSKELSQSSGAKADVEVDSREPDVTENGNLVERLHQDTDSAREASSSAGPNQLRRHENSQIVAAKGGWEPDVARNDQLDQTKVSLSASVDASSSSSNEATLFESEELSRAAMPNGGEAARMVLNVGDGFKLAQQGVVGDYVKSARTEASSPLRAPFIFQNKESSESEIESEEEEERRRGQNEVKNFTHEQVGVAKPNNQGPTPNNLSLQRKASLNSGMLKKRLQYMVDNGKFERRVHVGNAAASAVGTPRSQDEPSRLKTKESLQLAATNKEAEGIDGVAVESCNLQQIGPAKLPSEPVSSNESNHLDKDSLGSAIRDGKDGDITVRYSPRNAKEQPKTNSGETGTADRIYHHDDRAESSNIVHGELVEPKYLPKSLTRQSLAYDGSVSSFDGRDDQLMDQQSLQLDKEILQGPSKVEYLVDGDLNWDDHIMQRRSEIQQQANCSSATTSRQAIHAATTTRGSHPRRNRRRSDGEFLSRHPFDLRNSHMAYESSSSSNFVHDDEYHRPLTRPPPHSRYGDRRIYPDVYWNEKELPMYSNREASGEIYHDLLRRYSRRRQSGDSQQSYNYAPQIPYPGEAMAMPNMYPVHDPYLHCRHPEEVRWAPHLPPPPPAARFSRRLQHTAHASHQSWDPYESYAARPARFMDYESYGQDILSDDQRHTDDMRRRLYLRKKNQPAQQYFRPVVGGAPFITCYLCSELLLLPSDFLLFKRRCHQLKCGACKRMLKFSLENGRYLVPYCVPNDKVKHHEAVGSDATTKSMNPPGTLHPHQRVNSHRSSSGGGSRVNNNAGIAERIPQTSSKGRDRESGRDELGSSRSKGKNIVETEDAAASASIRSRYAKVTREAPPRSTSPLHRLMGYASPSQVLYASSDSEDLKREREQRSTN